MTGDIEGIVGAGESALYADAAAKELKPGRRGAGGTCANCGATLVGPHCHECGQVADDLHRPLWSLVGDALEGLFSLDGRFVNTVPALMLKPGRVTADYLGGARARFVQPFRLYLFASVIFLLAVSLTGGWNGFDLDPAGSTSERIERVQTELQREAEAQAARGDEAGAARIQSARDRLAADRAAIDAGDAAERERLRLERQQEMKCGVRHAVLPEEPGACSAAEDESDAASNTAGDDDIDLDEGIKSWPIGFRRLIVHQSEVIIDDPSRFLDAIKRWLSRVLIGLFPIYALLLGLMHFWKRRFYYYDHMVVSLHFHAFLFLLLSALAAAGTILPSWLLAIVFVIWSNYYVYKTHRLVYGSGRFSAAARTLVIDFLYFCILSFVPVVLVVGGFFTA